MVTETRSYPAATQQTFQLLPEQEARKRRRLRYMRLAIYLPVTIVALLWLALIVSMIWLAIAGKWFRMDTNQAYYRQLISGVADAFTILMLTPILLLCAVPTVISVGLYFFRRQRRSAEPQGPEKLAWYYRVENAIIALKERTSDTLPRIANPIINAHATAALVSTFLAQLKMAITRENDRNAGSRQ